MPGGKFCGRCEYGQQCIKNRDCATRLECRKHHSHVKYDSTTKSASNKHAIYGMCGVSLKTHVDRACQKLKRQVQAYIVVNV